MTIFFKIKNGTLKHVIYFEFSSLGEKIPGKIESIKCHRPVFIIYGKSQQPALWDNKAEAWILELGFALLKEVIGDRHFSEN